jgi:hypothetical protein
MPLEIHDVFKWVSVIVSAFIVIIALYVPLIRKFDLLRFLFGMKTTGTVFNRLGKRSALIVFHFLYIGLIVFASVHHAAGGGGRTPMPLTYDPEQDILLDGASITAQSSTGIGVVVDHEASIGKAIEFSAGANQQAKSQPEVYCDMHFSAPAGRYFIWLRGKSDLDDGYTDSIWLQVDDQIGTGIRSVRMGNWLDVHPAGVYGWAGDTDKPIAIELKYTGEHTIRIQPRQIPHRIDQIWLSRSQHSIPNTTDPIK